ncbi:MAG: ATP-binding cassette domain-containing protein [Acidimicrobiales bacterium]
MISPGVRPAVSVSGLVVRCRDQVLVGPVDFEVAAGATLGLRGRSGAGKSTVLRALVGLLPPPLTAAGNLVVLGEQVGRPGVDLPALRARAVLVGQTPVVFPASILANAAFGLRHAVRMPRAELRRRAEAALEEAGLWTEVAGRLGAPAEQLSVGQRQRLCLARALALDPVLLLLDEPTSALDAASTGTVEAAVAGLSGRRTVLIVSHDQAQLERLCTDVVSLDAGARAVPAGAAG